MVCMIMHLLCMYLRYFLISRQKISFIKHQEYFTPFFFGLFKMESNSVILSTAKTIANNLSNSSRSQKIISISAAILATFTYVLFKNATSPPKKLKHIPNASYVKMVMAYYTAEPLMEITKKYIDPILTKSTNGLYLVIYLIYIYINIYINIHVRMVHLQYGSALVEKSGIYM